MENARPTTINRRRLLELGGKGAIVVVAATATSFRGGHLLAAQRVPDNPFTLGIASGDPHPHGVVLWTRLAPNPLAADGRGGMPEKTVPVQWQVANDESFRRIVRRGTELARPRLAHSVHAEVDGLAAGRDYFYRFKAGSEISPVGRTKTAPATGGRAKKMAFAFASCQLYESGYYSAYRDMAEQDLDFVVHLGDYIYAETYLGAGAPRPHDPEPEAKTVSAYRRRYAQYKTDPDLQAAHAASPWVVTFDDHEVQNDWADEDSQNDDPRARFLRRRAAALRAFYEHMPLRRSSLPQGPDMRIYRNFTFGDLARFGVLDTRQYRSDQPCGEPLPGSVGSPDCPDRYDPQLAMTGSKQERWLLRNLSRSRARWNVLANQVMMAEYDYDPGSDRAFNMDQWDGYPKARKRVLRFLKRRQITNPIVITGDWHSSWVNDLKGNFRDPDSATVGTEFLGPSITTPCIWAADVARALPDNPHVKFFDGNLHGYVRCTVTRDLWRSDYRAVTASSPDESATTLTSWVVEDGKPGAQPA
jgi:alkaline phosphatase D